MGTVQENEPLLGSGFWGLVIALGVVLILVLPGMAIYEVYTWLRYGAWPSINMYDVLLYAKVDAPKVNWIGIQRISDWICKQQIILTVPIFGVLVAIIASHYQDEAEKRERDRRASKRGAANNPSSYATPDE